MTKCSQCGGKLRRVHRTLLERFQYLAIYECLECDLDTFVPRPYQHHLGPYSRCPHCGTLRLSRLKQRDRIDRMHRGFLNVLERLAGGKLIHCRFCRLQFYDRRPLAAEAPTPGEQEMGPAEQ
jgi:hypothetical protein